MRNRHELCRNQEGSCLRWMSETTRSQKKVLARGSGGWIRGKWAKGMITGSSTFVYGAHMDSMTKEIEPSVGHSILAVIIIRKAKICYGLPVTGALLNILAFPFTLSLIVNRTTV